MYPMAILTFKPVLATSATHVALPCFIHGVAMYDSVQLLVAVYQVPCVSLRCTQRDQSNRQC